MEDEQQQQPQEEAGDDEGLPPPSWKGGTPSSNLDNVFTFERDSNSIICGPTSSGKTTLILDILSNGNFDERPDSIYVLAPSETLNAKNNPYKKAAPELSKKGYNVHFIAGLDDAFDFISQLSTNDVTNAVLVVDDFGSKAKKPVYQEILEQLFFVTTHQKNLWTFFMVHDIFAPGAVSLRRNTQNFILFDVLSDMSAARQYISKLVGKENVEIFLTCWRWALDNHPSRHGFIRYDVRLRGDPRKILTCNGISLSSGGVFLHADSVAPTSLFE